ncbi:hypothetical protein AZE42_08277 [Rhizopogon vesiculosus]|uniref:Protein-S-isoprenylcysteine O-methyltransferase n=1 Tax=Rhizopogon vesiculosus TaxID=180088 RepID=A0A1J8R163_9AGAM|nr:hypothetical protein AZE42_08277 [Rhizopogon vesiculosus]
MTLLRLPFLVPSVLIFNASYIPPTTAPHDEVVIGGPFYERICPVVYPVLQRLSGLIPCVAEIAVILAAHFPSPLSSTVLSTLVHGRLPELMPNRYFVLGTTLVAIGGLGRMWCFRVMGRHFTHELSIRKNHRLVTAGPYSIVRHPGYASSWIALSGMSLIYASPGSFVRSSGWLSTYFGRAVLGVWVGQVVLSLVLSRARSISEDAMLRKHFGEEWDRWSKRVPYRLIPGIF